NSVFPEVQDVIDVFSVLAVCGGPKGFKAGTFTKASLEAACQKIAECCNFYGISVTPNTVYTHYEFGLRNKGTDSSGKIDINQIPWEPSIAPQAVGNYIRQRVSSYL
ncbi:MAG: hypothetical protein ACK5T0_02745, partial [Vampirovibrionales bacterium]